MINFFMATFFNFDYSKSDKLCPVMNITVPECFALRFVHNEQADTACHARQNRFQETLIVQSLW